MERTYVPWLMAFAALCGVELVAEALAVQPLIYATKPLLMPVLAIWFALRTSGVRRFLRQTVIAGLLLSMLGDILLMFSGGGYGTLFFLLGLVAFLCAHLCYTGGFLTEVNLRNGLLRKQPYWVAPFVVFLIVFVRWLWPGIPEGMRLPVAAYASVISMMALSVVNMRNHLDAAVANTILAGALLFMLSDSLIAVQKFGHPFAGSRVVIMATYLAGQWLIARGVGMRLRRIPAAV